MVAVQHLIGAQSFPAPISPESLSVFNYNVLLPNSVDGWWTYVVASCSCKGSGKGGSPTAKFSSNLIPIC